MILTASSLTKHSASSSIGSGGNTSVIAGVLGPSPTMNDTSRSVNRVTLAVLAILLLSTSLACSLGQMLVGEPTPTPTLVPAIVPPTWTPSPVGQLSPGQIATLTVIAGISFPTLTPTPTDDRHAEPDAYLRASPAAARYAYAGANALCRGCCAAGQSAQRPERSLSRDRPGRQGPDLCDHRPQRRLHLVASLLHRRPAGLDHHPAYRTRRPSRHGAHRRST